MCGICGVFVFDPATAGVEASSIIAMRDSMAHRGPDGEGLWISSDRCVGLGHRRLSIIDLSNMAGQPMSNGDGSLLLVFNGEIYNHAEIRNELEKTGKYRWKTDHSDTEVILHAFEEWGIGCLRRFRGMFAIALWDDRNKELWLIRDRIGKKPLYYSLCNGKVSFASEIKALLSDPAQKRAVNEDALFHYLSFLTTPAPMTLFEGIQKLPPGTWMRFGRDGRTETKRYWDVWEETQPLAGVGEEEIAQRVLQELRVAVRLRKVSDVPVGVFLSGGIDSSTNAALFSEQEKRPVKTFTIGYKGNYKSYQNELAYARTMAQRVGAEHHELLLTVDDLTGFLPHMVYLQDEPIADPVCVPLYYVSKLARDNGVIVCQVGEGSDELFWGYPYWKRRMQYQRIINAMPRAVRSAGVVTCRMLNREGSAACEILRRGADGQPVFWGGAEAFTEGEKRQLLSPRLRKKYSKLSSWDVLAPLYRNFQEKAWEPSVLHWMTYLDLNLRLPELLLMRVDKMSMGVSLESRTPFLDHKLVELVMGIPENIKTKDGELKHILKKAVRGLIPDELIDRPKQGFGVPVYEWFFEKLGDMTRREVREFCGSTDLFDMQAVEALMAKGRGSELWYLLNLALWWKQWIR